MMNVLLSQHDYFVRSALAGLTPDQEENRLKPETASALFLMRHMAESILYTLDHYMATASGYTDYRTVFVADTGQAGERAEVEAIVDKALVTLNSWAHSASEAELDEVVESYVGPKSRRELIGQMVYHSYYHIGQAVQAAKKGEPARELAIAA